MKRQTLQSKELPVFEAIASNHVVGNHEDCIKIHMHEGVN